MNICIEFARKWETLTKYHKMIITKLDNKFFVGNKSDLANECNCPNNKAHFNKALDELISAEIVIYKEKTFSLSSNWITKFNDFNILREKHNNRLEY